MASAERMVIEFDKPIQDVPLAASNWNAGAVPAMASVIDPTQVELIFATPLEPVEVQYLASPPDVVGEAPDDVPVAAFVMPVT